MASEPKARPQPAHTLDRPDLLVPAPPTPSTFTPPTTMHTQLAVLPTPDHKGLGVFARHDIAPGSIILYERALLILPSTDSELPVLNPDPLDAVVEQLGEREREEFGGLCGYSGGARRGNGDGGQGESENRAVLGSNGFSVMGGSGTGVFGFAARINHSCVPNCWFEWRELEGEGGRAGESGKEGGEREGGLLIWNSWALMEGEEVTIDYGHKSGVNGALRNWYGFVCACGACTDGESEDERDEDTDEGDAVAEMEVEGMKGRGGEIDINKNLSML